MCTIVKSRISKRSEEDLVCYKILEIEFGNKNYQTPYTYFPVSTDIINGKEPLIAENKESLRKTQFESGTYWSVNGGYIHTYMDLECAKNKILTLRETYDTSIFNLFKCIIPKGTKYYVGFNDGFLIEEAESYASEKISFVEQVDF